MGRSSDALHDTRESASFGVLALRVVRALIPSTDAEGRAASRLRENADKREPVKQALTESVQQVKENLVPAAQEGAQHVKGASKH